jgi:hypothetical protein
MAVREAFGSGQLETGTSINGDLLYLVDDVEDEQAAINEVIAVAPSDYSGISRSGQRAKELYPGTWLVSVNYSQRRNMKTPVSKGQPSTFSFDTSGGTKLIKEDLGCDYYWDSATGVKELFEGDKFAINQNSDGEVEGIEVEVPVFTWEETHYKLDSEVTQAYILNLYELTGKVNNAAFRVWGEGDATWDAGTVKFRGARGAKRGTIGDYELTFRFAAAKNVTNPTVGWGSNKQTLTGITKKAWQYLESVWIKKSETVNNKTSSVNVPSKIILHTVSEEGDFSTLGI